MPEVGRDDPAVLDGTYIRLDPCATREPGDPDICHAYEALRKVGGAVIGSLGWFSLGQVRTSFADEPYLIGRGSHGQCPECFTRINGTVDPDAEPI